MSKRSTFVKTIKYSQTLHNDRGWQIYCKNSCEFFDIFVVGIATKLRQG